MSIGAAFGVALAASALSAPAAADVLAGGHVFAGSSSVLGMHTSALFADPTLRARRTYEVIASLPVPSSIDQTYDLRGFVAPVVDAQLHLSPTVVLGFPLGISGKHVFTADFGVHTRVALGPSDGFGRGGLFSLRTDF
jgi:hypothetical protein